MIKIIHQRNKCIGCDACVQEFPECWEIDETDGKALLKGSLLKKELYILEVPGLHYWEHLQASESCPVSIISISGAVPEISARFMD